MKHNRTKTKEQRRNNWCDKNHLNKSQIKYIHSYRAYVYEAKTFAKYWWVYSPDDISPKDRTEENYCRYKNNNNLTEPPRFKIGDIINSSLSSQQIVQEIRIGVKSDFVDKIINYTGKLCYVLRYVYGKQHVTVFSVESIDKNCHLKGTKEFEVYDKKETDILTF